MPLPGSWLPRRALRRAVDAIAARVARSERLVSLGYELYNEVGFSHVSRHEEMLNDTVRVEAYHRGIHGSIEPGDVVVDVGTGTGVLACFARRAGAGHVHAIDHSDFIEVARAIAERNGIDGIEFVRTHSRDFTPSRPVDVLVHEQMGDELFNENVLETILDLRERVLRRGGRIVPGRFRLYVEPVVFHDAFRVRRLWNTELPDDIDLSGTASLVGDWDDGRMDVLWVRPGSVASTVGEPSPILEIDLHTLASPADVPLVHDVERVAAEGAIVDGLCVWFEAEFDEGTVLSTSPLAPLTSWGNRLFRLDHEVRAGDVVAYRVDLGVLAEPSTWTARLR